MTPAAARYISSAGVDHPHYDLALLLSIEPIVNAVRYDATTFNVCLTDDPENNAWKREFITNGSGVADFERMKGFQQNNGTGTSRYGIGLWANQFAGDPSGALHAHRIAKVAGEEDATYVETTATSSLWKPYPMHITHPKNPFKTVESSGFYDFGYIRKERLPKVKSIQDFACQFREMVCVKTDQIVLDKLKITLTINGQLISDSWRDKWQSLETVLQNNPNVAKYDKHVTKSGAVTVTANYYRIARGIEIDYFPNYGKHHASSTMVHMHQEGFQNHEAPVHEVFGLKIHPTSQNGCVAVVTFSASSPAELPTPAGTRTNYLPTCEIYKHLVGEVRKLQPVGWINAKFALPVAAAPAPVAAAPAPVAAAPAPTHAVSDSEESSSSKKERKKRAPMTEEAKAAMKAKREATIAAKKVVIHEPDRAVLDDVQAANMPETDAATITRLEARVAELEARVAELEARVAELEAKPTIC
jgi:hypothetical protein